MAWTERQQAMLAAMGLRVWAPPPALAARPETGRVEAGGEVALAEPVQRAASARPDDHGTSQPQRAAAPAQASRERDGAPPRSPAPATPASASALVPPPPPAGRAERAGEAEASGSIRGAHIAAMDWPALREAVAGCQACGLCEHRRNTVFGVGHEQADWMVIGEAPGEQEDLRGEPFVGKAGQLLDAMLDSIGLSRNAPTPAQQVFIANTLKCRPPRNRNPSPEELLRCEPFLQRQIALVQPRVILAMGRFAVQALLRSDQPVSRLRGRVHQYAGAPLIVTYHPAYLLRTPDDKARAWEDLCLARSVAAGRRPAG